MQAPVNLELCFSTGTEGLVTTEQLGSLPKPIKGVQVTAYIRHSIHQTTESTD